MNILKRLRADKRLTLRALADKSGVNVNTIQYIESGQNNARLGTIARLAAALEVDITVLEPLMTQVKSDPKLKAAA